MNANSNITVIAIDGPSASGKGTVAQRVAEQLGFAYLDSGALYRIVALAADQQGISWQDEPSLAKLASQLLIKFEENKVWLNGSDVSEAIRTEHIGKGASEVAVHPALRASLLELQRSFSSPLGLVADGRDMSTVVFPEAQLKIFLTASAQIRAERRYKQLMSKGIHANLADLLEDLIERDNRDKARSAAPLKQSAEAKLLDTSNLTIQEAVAQVLSYYKSL